VSATNQPFEFVRQDESSIFLTAPHMGAYDEPLIPSFATDCPECEVTEATK
jgi:hypothetical protein